jgi:hypothetical protein
MGLRPVTGQTQDFYAPGSPLAGGILFGGHADFLPRFQAFRTAFPLLSGRDLLPEDDDGVGHFHAPQQVVAALDKNPSRRGVLVERRINDFALKNSFGGNRGPGGKQNQQGKQRRLGRAPRA